jgi:hypothetical protein
MERITSKLTRVLVITLLSAATLATAGSLTLKASSGVTPQATLPVPRHPLCELAVSLREQNKPFATEQTQCNFELEARGAVLANYYPWAAELRDQRPEGPARRGLYIGLAASEGQTSPGPGKQGIGASLTTLEERLSFDLAVSTSLERNMNPERYKNADLGKRGAGSDESSAREPRSRESEPLVRRGPARNLRASLDRLKQIRESLEAADPDQDGHVEKAIDHTNKAIEELRKALAPNE